MLYVPCSRAYPARIRYIEGEVGRALRKQSHIVCEAECGVCRTASLVYSRRLSQQQVAPPAAAATAAGLVASDGASSSSSQHALPTVGGLPPAIIAAAASSSSPGRGELSSPPPSPHYLLPAAGAAERQGGEEWQELEGHWCSIMLIGEQPGPAQQQHTCTAATRNSQRHA